jgi:predicted GTPase
MTSLFIKYNPYIIKTDITVNGRKPKDNSFLNIGKKRLQEWVDELPTRIYDEFLDKDLSIEFVGMEGDFRDLEEAFSGSGMNVSYKTDLKPGIDVVEESVINIYEEIQAGPVPELKDRRIVQAFETAKNQEFDINVVATMSAGKSTLINALLSKKLMPAKKEATTATIVRIKDTDSPKFEAEAFDRNGNLLKRIEDLKQQDMRILNDDKEISQINIYGRIPFLSDTPDKKIRLVLVDTPGPNNSNDNNHRTLTYRMLENSDKSLVLYVVNSNQFGINDDAVFLDFVCQQMAKCGKQSKDRFFFVVNQLDSTNPEEYDSPNCIEENLQKVKAYIEKRGVKDPNIFPASALVALSSRLDERPGPFTSWPRFVEQYRAMDIFKFDDYYAFNHLPQRIQEQNNALLNTDCTREQEVDLHSGVKCVEQAIALYIDKYARPTKVFDLTQSFNEKLKEVAAFDNLVVSISKDKEAAERIKKQIANIQQRIGDANRASDFSQSLEGKTKQQSKTVGEKINKLVDPLLTEITSLIASDNKLPIEQAKSKCLGIENRCQELTAKLISQVESIVEDDYKKVVDAIVDEYKKQLTTLNIADGGFVQVDPLKLVAGEFDRIDDYIKESTKEEVVGQKRVTKTKRVFEESNRKWYNLWGLGIFGHGDRFVDKQYIVTEDIIGEVVDMAKLTDEYLLQYQLFVDDTRKNAIDYTEIQRMELVNNAKDVKKKIDQILSDKLKELEKVQSDDKTLQEAMHQKEKNLQWLQSIQTRINNLIVF